MRACGFLEPQWGLAAIGIGIVLFFITRAVAIRRSRTKILGLKPTARGYALYAGIVAVLLSMIIALTRPYCGHEEVTINQSGLDTVFVVDVSLSMLTKDVSPSRIEVAKRKLKDLLDKIEKNSPGDRIGIVLFAGSSYLFCPLTNDLSVVNQFLNSISPSMVTSRGSSLELGIGTAFEALKRSKSSQGRILVVTDGEAPNSSALEGSTQDGLKIPIDVLGVGTVEGKPIELDQGKFVKDRSGQIVISKLSESGLQKLAADHGGIYRRVGLGDADIDQIFSASRSTSSEFHEHKIVIYNEFGSFFLIISLLSLTFLRFRYGVGLLIGIFVLSFPYTSFAENPGTAREGYERYENGDYKGALTDLGAAYATDPGDRSVAHAYAASLFRLGDYAKSSEVFSKLLKDAKSGRERYISAYNQGNALLAGKQYQQAISAYDTALTAKPSDEEATYNKEIAKQLLEKSEQEKKKDKDKDKDKDNQKQQQDQKNDNQNKDQDSKENQDQNKQNDKPNPSASPDPKGSPSATESPSQDTPDKPTGKDTAPPTAQPEETKNKESERQKETTSKDQESKEDKADDHKQEAQKEATPEPPAPQKQAGAADKAKEIPLPQREANAWLSSLPDSPLLLRRDSSKSPKNSEQAW